MIHPKISSPCTPQRKKRQTNSGRILTGSGKSVKQDEQTIPTEPEEPVPIRYSDLYKQKKAHAEMGNMFRKKKSYPIAPDALIPNSSCRTVFKRTEIKPIEPKAFRLRLDILDNLQNKNKKNWQDDDEEWAELDDPDAPSKSTGEKKIKGTAVLRQKDTIPDLFKRMQNESWWKHPKEDKPNLRSMLLYLNEIIKLKEIESYESACYYIVEIFRTYGIEPVLVNQILDILLDHLLKNGNVDLDICTIRTLSQFMIERKDIIIHLLEYALKCQPIDTIQMEIINAIKFITDVNNSDDIELVLENMSAVYETSDDNFSLKMIIKGLESKKKIVVSEVINEGEETDEIHPLLKKISEERWFPRGQFSITLDYVLEAIITKLSDATKTLIKTLTTHLVQLHRIIGFSNEQFDRVANSMILLLSHIDADYRLIAATNLANLNKETKSIDIALLNSFINDPRILVRTECCDTLKKLTGIMSDTVLSNCADDIAYLQTLSEENFSLQNYLKEKNRLPTEISILPMENKIDEEEDIPTSEIESSLTNDQIEIKEDIRSRPPSPEIIKQPTFTLPVLTESTQFSATASVSSSMTSIKPSIRVEINEKHNSVIQRERNKQSISSTKTSISDQINQRRSSLLPNNTNMWDSYEKQSEIIDQREDNESELNYPAPQSTLINQEQINDPIQNIIEEHKQTVGFYRMIPPRRVLIPHKISMSDIFADQSHIMVNHYSSQSPMNLSDLNHNQYQLNEVESIQLLSSVVIRSIQVHRQYERFIPGPSTSPSFTAALSVSQIPIRSSLSFQQSTVNSSSKLPLIGYQRPTSRQFTRMQSNVQTKATREGINVHKAQNMEGILSNLLKTNREQTKSTMLSSSISYSSSTRQTDITHAWLLIQLLKSQGIFHSEIYIQKILQAYPKFTSLLHTRIPQTLISTIWNDPVINQLASIFSNKRDPSSITNSTMKRSDTKPSVSLTDDDYSFTGLDYSTLVNSYDQKKKYLPIIRGSKMNLPRHVLKFGFRQIEIDSSELSNTSLHEENKSKSRKRRVQMHLMMSGNDNTFDRHETVKSQLGHVIKTDYQTTSFVPIVTRPPMCH